MTSLIVAVLVLLTLYVGAKRLSGLETLFVLMLFLSGIVLTLFPALSSSAARTLRVGRGSDLLFYLTLLGGLFVASNFYFRFKRTERMLTLVVRKLALAEKDPVASPDDFAGDIK